MCFEGRLSRDGGSVFGWPERACCVCGRAGWLRSNAAREAEAVRQVVFIATHAVDEQDAVILQHYAKSVRQMPDVALWLLLFDNGVADVERYAAEVRSSESMHGLPVGLWGEGDVRRLYPRMHTSLQRSARNGSIELMGRSRHGPRNRGEMPTYLRYYYFFHTSLLVWHAVHGHAFPHLKFVWRLEMDVLYAGSRSIGGLVSQPMRSAHAEWDLLLPDISFRDTDKSVMGAHRDTDDKSYPHWRIAEGVGALASRLPDEEAILRGVPRKQQAFALVCAGRFSMAFMRLMDARWKRGVIGYEEVLLPTTCATRAAAFAEAPGAGAAPAGSQHETDTCTMAPLGARAKIGVRRIRYRPEYVCEDFLAAWRLGTTELWHPIKNRSCYVRALQGERAALSRHQPLSGGTP